MHPDRKIGIAMGILLIGVVGALFFRNEPLPESASLSRTREEQLNQRLRDRDVAVYLDGSEEVPVSDERPVWTLEEALNQQRHAEPARPISVSMDSEDAAVSARSQAPEYAPPTKEASAASEASLFDGITVGGEARRSGETQLTTNDPSRDDRPEDAVFEEYEVQFGDTLSGISQRFLGTSSRYNDIYKANQDRIDNPDRLRVGTAIRIPRTLR